MDGIDAREIPLALAEHHRSLAVGDELTIDIVGLDPELARAVCIGAGFAVEALTTRPEDGADGPGREPPTSTVRLRRLLSLADTVGDGMRVLTCGLNPSVYAAEVGIGFARPGNRFWPAAIAAGLVTNDRDPVRALLDDGVGMTDLVKRATPRAAELTADEYRSGLVRLERLVAWLAPKVVCFVGLAGWRAAVDRRATAGLQPEPLAGTPVYLMPSTSGLNASSRLEDLTAHFRAAAELVDDR